MALAGIGASAKMALLHDRESLTSPYFQTVATIAILNAIRGDNDEPAFCK
jgi:hypothetical protein